MLILASAGGILGWIVTCLIAGFLFTIWNMLTGKTRPYQCPSCQEATTPYVPVAPTSHPTCLKCSALVPRDLLKRLQDQYARNRKAEMAARR